MGTSGQLHLRPQRTGDRSTHTATRPFPPSCSGTLAPADLPTTLCHVSTPFSMSAEGSNCVCPSLQHLASTRASANCQRNERTQAFRLWKTSRPYKIPPFDVSQPLQTPYPGPWHDLATSYHTSLIPTILLHSLSLGHISLLTVPQHAGPDLGLCLCWYLCLAPCPQTLSGLVPPCSHRPPPHC